MALIGFVVALMSLTVAIMALLPEFNGQDISKKSLELSEWTALNDYVEWCEDILQRGKNSSECEKATTMSLPPPPYVETHTSPNLKIRTTQTLTIISELSQLRTYNFHHVPRSLKIILVFMTVLVVIFIPIIVFARINAVRQGPSAGERAELGDDNHIAKTSATAPELSHAQIRRRHPRHKTICLLSLDGGGVRCLSTLYTLEKIMAELNENRRQIGLGRVKPCDVFDLIGGSGTGGLIAIMLGQLQMDVETCITTYTEITKPLFNQTSMWRTFNLILQTVCPLQRDRAIMIMIAANGGSVYEPFNNGVARSSLFVRDRLKCHIRICFEAITFPGGQQAKATIFQAARATLAASTFFPPISGTSPKPKFAAINPIQEVEKEAEHMWCSGGASMNQLVNCIISVGTGDPELRNADFGTAAEETAIQFERESTYDKNQYFRFNVQRRLDDVALDRKTQERIIASTRSYLNSPEQQIRLRNCANSLSIEKLVRFRWGSDWSKAATMR